MPKIWLLALFQIFHCCFMSEHHQIFLCYFTVCLSTTVLYSFLGFVGKFYSALLVQCAMIIMLSMVLRPVLKGLQHVNQGSDDCADSSIHFICLLPFFLITA